MTREEIIQGLQFTIDMFLSDPLTGEPITKPRNDMDKTTIDACKGAIELLTQEPCEDAIKRKHCPYRHENGNCLKIGGFCTSVDDKYCLLNKNLESCEDAISRADAIKTAIEAADDWDGGYNLTRADIIEKAIESLPSVQPKIKTGHWILLDECSNCGYYCSECHKKLVKEGWSGTVKKIKFCPNCGCRMVEPQESEEV